MRCGRLAHEARERREEVPRGQLAEVQLALGCVVRELVLEAAEVLELAPAPALLEVVRGALEAAVLDQALDQLVLGVEQVVVERDLLTRQERARLDREQRRRHDEVIPRHLDVEALEAPDVQHVSVDDLGEAHVLDLHLLFLDEVQEQIERALEEVRQMERVLVLARHRAQRPQLPPVQASSNS
jgi:hypothetical protein